MPLKMKILSSGHGTELMYVSGVHDGLNLNQTFL